MPQVPFRYITGLPQRAQFEIERDFAALSPDVASHIHYDDLYNTFCGEDPLHLIVADPTHSTYAGDANSAFGYHALYANEDGTSNVAVGFEALVASTGDRNVAVGCSALWANTTGSSNTAFGDGALSGNTTNGENTAVGAGAGCGTGAKNTSVGAYALGTSYVAGSNNTAIGAYAFNNLSTGTPNVALGYQAGYAPGGITANATTTGNNQTLVGAETGLNSTTQRDDVTAVGYRALVGAADTVALGSGAQALHANSVALGKGIVTTAANQVMLGPNDLEITDGGKGIVLQDVGTATRKRITLSNDAIYITAA